MRDPYVITALILVIGALIVAGLATVGRSTGRAPTKEIDAELARRK